MAFTHSRIHHGLTHTVPSQLDGVDALDNVLVVGMTNRPELIDPALLRPGRLEVHVPIELPDAAGRSAVLQIHARSLRDRGCLSAGAAAAIGDPSVAIGPLAAVTAGYSGADLAGLVRSAASFALERYIGRDRLVGAEPAEIFADGSAGESELEVRLDDLVSALREVAPGAHGARRAAPLGKAGAGRRGVRERLRLARQTSRLRAMCRGSESAES